MGNQHPLSKRLSQAYLSKFFRNVDQGRDSENLSKRCWKWCGTLNNGYGRFNDQYAHRIAYLIHYGHLPESKSGFEVRHLCHNRPCVNPFHLKLGTRKQNVQDSIDARLHVHGSRSPGAKLNEAIVLEARRRYWENNEALGPLADEYGVNPSVLYCAVAGMTWSHVAMPASDVQKARIKQLNPVRGEDAPWSVLREKDVVSMRKAYWLDRVPLEELASKYRMSIGGVRDLVQGINWEHVWMPPKKVRDARERRTERGESHPKAKLSDAEVRAIRRMRARGTTYAAIGRRFGTTPSNVRWICTGQSRRSA